MLNRFQQPMTLRLLNTLGYCSCDEQQYIQWMSGLNTGMGYTAPQGMFGQFGFPGFAVQGPKTAFANSSQEDYAKSEETQSGNSDKSNSKISPQKSDQPMAEHDMVPAEQPSELGNQVESGTDEEELKDDNDLLLNHPYEIKYILNKKTNRRLKRMVCKFEGCNKVFEKKWNFKDHIRMHRRDTPYQCKICNKKFTQRGNLVKHERQHKFKTLKSRKVHRCTICSKSFTEKYNLKVSRHFYYGL